MMLAMTTAVGLRADEARIVANLKQYLLSGDAGERQQLVARMRTDPAWDRDRVGEWLHRLDLYPALERGRYEVEVAVGYGHTRLATVRIPRGYRPDRPWPLIYALHPSGGTGPSFLSHAEKILGKLAEQYVIAAPTHYRQTVLDAPPPFTPEHPVMLERLRREVHVAGDRVYLLGHSTGGYTSWTLAMLHADEFAGAVPMGSTNSLPADVEGLWEAFAPNFAEVPVLHVWGGRDRLDVPGFETLMRAGNISSLNRRFSRLIKELGLNVVDHQLPRAGHGGLQPPADALALVLTHRRTAYPKRVHHLFRHVHQARAYWLEGHEWEGAHWGEEGYRKGRPVRGITKQPGESRAQAIARLIMPLLGDLQGEIDGQTIRIGRRHVKDLTLWIGDGMIDWHQPITVVLEGKTVFSGKVEPDLGVCLSQAARTWDFDRLRWAGLRIDGRGEVRPVTPAMVFPPLIRVP